MCTTTNYTLKNPVLKSKYFTVIQMKFFSVKHPGVCGAACSERFLRFCSGLNVSKHIFHKNHIMRKLKETQMNHNARDRTSVALPSTLSHVIMKIKPRTKRLMSLHLKSAWFTDMIYRMKEMRNSETTECWNTDYNPLTFQATAKFLFP